MGKALVIVESPAKAKTINKYLGKDFIVKSSVGHIRDLPTSGNAPTTDPKERAAQAAISRRISIARERRLPGICKKRLVAIPVVITAWCLMRSRKRPYKRRLKSRANWT